MLKMNFGCQVSWDSVPAAVGFISPECTTREEPLRVRSLSGSFRGLYWQWAREVYSLKIVRQSDFPVRIYRLASCDVFEKAGVGLERPEQSWLEIPAPRCALSRVSV